MPNFKWIKTQVCMTETVLSYGSGINTGYEIQTHHCKLTSFLFFILFYVPLKNFSLISRLNHYRWRGFNFLLYSALMAIDQWRFFISLSWHTSYITGYPFKMHFKLLPKHLESHWPKGRVFIDWLIEWLLYVKFTFTKI